jgi:pimeloyl-ACP methyl ester carboxylesterase
MLTDHTYDTGAVELHYVQGPNGGSPLIYLHGATASWVSILPSAPWLGLRHTLYAMGMRGHGRSGRAPAPYRATDMGDDVCALIQGCVQAPATLYGASLGGSVSAYVAARHPEWVTALVLLDPPFGRAIADASLARGFLPLFQRRRELAARHYSPAEMRAELHPQTSPERRWALTLSQLDVALVDSLLDGRVWDGYDADAIAAGIHCPTLVLYGDVDKGGVLTPEDAEWLRATIPHCVVNHLPMGHGPSPAQQPEMAMIICEFLESLE